jgi:hypothetical protein
MSDPERLVEPATLGDPERPKALRAWPFVLQGPRSEADQKISPPGSDPGRPQLPIPKAQFWHRTCVISKAPRWAFPPSLGRLAAALPFLWLS